MGHNRKNALLSKITLQNTKITMQKAEPFMNNVMKFFEIKKNDDPKAMMHYFFSTLEGVQLHVTFNPLYPIDKVKKILKKQFLK